MSLWSRFRNLIRSPAGHTHDPDLDKLQALLGYRFDNLSLLELGLTHRSVPSARRGQSSSYERLEFLGDSVLGLIVAEELYHDHPELPEGELTKRKAMLVSETALARVGIETGFNQFIRLSPEEEASGGRERPSIVSDSFEAVIAAVYCDGGLDAARRMIRATLYSLRDDIMNDGSQRNYKGELLELVQAHGGGMPQYEIVLESGPDHDKKFHVAVRVNGQQVGDGVGTSKKEAEQQAAGVALRRLSDTDPA